MIRGDDSLRSRAIRGMRFAHYLGATGTPISNYVNDAFHGLVWALRPASARFPYDMEGKAQFERDFCVIEHQMGKEGTEKEGKRVRRKILPEVTNLSVLWRLLSTAIIRRRKEDTGEPLVSRTFRPVRVPFGERQLALHEKWLADFKRFFEQTHPTSPLVQAGIVHLFCAAVGQLPKLEYAATLPEADPDLAWTAVEASNWTPKTLKVLELCLERVRAGDKVLVGSCLVETGRFLAEHLRERGVEALHIVEEREGRAQTKAPRKRAAEIAAFYEGEAQVLCCGVQAVKLGHNMDVASSVILTGLPWSHEALDQFLARVHRLTSKRPVSVYVCLTKGSIDDRKWQLLSDKGAAADLALDGQLIEKREERVDWSAILREMQAAGVRATGEELAEEDVEALWRRAEGGLAPIAAPVPARHLRAVPALTGPPPPPAPVIPLHALAALDDPEQLELFAEAA
jgi:SNF2 family DNA or RNA helicase